MTALHLGNPRDKEADSHTHAEFLHKTDCTIFFNVVQWPKWE